MYALTLGRVGVVRTYQAMHTCLCYNYYKYSPSGAQASCVHTSIRQCTPACVTTITYTHPQAYRRRAYISGNAHLPVLQQLHVLALRRAGVVIRQCTPACVITIICTRPQVHGRCAYISGNAHLPVLQLLHVLTLRCAGVVRTYQAMHTCLCYNYYMYCTYVCMYDLFTLFFY